jgi:hypothetical protein
MITKDSCVADSPARHPGITTTLHASRHQRRLVVMQSSRPPDNDDVPRTLSKHNNWRCKCGVLYTNYKRPSIPQLELESTARCISCASVAKTDTPILVSKTIKFLCLRVYRMREREYVYRAASSCRRPRRTCGKCGACSRIARVIFTPNQSCEQVAPLALEMDTEQHMGKRQHMRGLCY